MGKRIVKVMAITQIVLAIVAYVSMSIHFNDDLYLFSMLARTDFFAVMLRLSVYIVPGIHLLAGLYGLVFSDKKVVTFIGLIELISCVLTLIYIGDSGFMNVLSIISVCIAGLYLLGAILIKNEK